MLQKMKNSLREEQLKLLKEQLQILLEEPKEPGYTISYVAEQWLLREKLVVKQSTYAKYRTNLDNHILPELGAMPITEINSMLINMYIQHLREDGRRDGRGGLSTKYVRDLYTILRGIIHYAELEYSLPSTIQNCRIPPKASYDSYVLSKQQQQRLEEYIKKDILDMKKLGILLCLYTGLRIGEVCALQWKDIQLDSGLLDICKTVQRIQNPNRGETPKTFLIIGTPKSKASLRTVPIPLFLIPHLKKQKRTHLEEAYFLSNRADRLIEPRNYQYHFKRYMKEIGMEQIHFHTLRHTFATRAIESGMDIKSLSEILGHAGVGITMDRYVHSSLEEKRRQIEKLCL